jgi:hypothetical protein
MLSSQAENKAFSCSLVGFWLRFMGCPGWNHCQSLYFGTKPNKLETEFKLDCEGQKKHKTDLVD